MKTVRSFTCILIIYEASMQDLKLSKASSVCTRKVIRQWDLNISNTVNTSARQAIVYYKLQISK